MTRPCLIALTATMPTSYLPLLSKLLTINSFSGNSLIRDTQNEFAKCKINMQTHITSSKGQYLSKGLTLVSHFIQDNNPSASAVVFCNSRKQSKHLRDHLERKLNKLKLNVYVVHINGSLHKTDKFWRIRLFCSKSHMIDANFCVLITTNAANVGIDKALISLQMRFDWPCDLLTYFQEQGRGLQQAGSKLTCIL